MLERVLVLLALLALSTAQLSDYVSNDELSTIQARSKKALLSPKCLSGAYHHTRLLQATTTTKLDCDCTGLGKLVKDKSNKPLDVYYGLKAADACGCDNVKPLRSVEDDIEEHMNDADIWNFGGAALAAKAMNIPTPSAADIVGKVTQLMQPSGLFRSARGSLGSSNLCNTKLALLVLSEFAGDSARNEAVTDIISTVSAKLLADAENEKVTDPSLVTYLHDITNKNVNLEASGSGASASQRLFAVTEALVALKYSEKSSVIAPVVQSLALLSNSDYKSRPVHVGLQDKLFNYGKAIKTSIDVRSALGKDVSGASIEVLSIVKEGKDKVLFKGNVEASVLDLSSKVDDFSPGRYAVQLAVILPGKKKPMQSELYFTVAAKLSVKEVSVGVTKSKSASDMDLNSITEANAWSGDSAYSAKNDYVHVNFAVSTPKKTGAKFQKPHQVFVRFTHVASGINSYFVGATKGTYTGKGSGNVYGVSVFLKKEVETFAHASGEYEVSVLAGDIGYQPTEHVIGSVSLNFPALDKPDPALYIKALLHTSDTTLQPLEDFEHKMRPDPTNAPVVVSAVFSGMVALPLVIFLKYMLTLGVDVKRMRTGASTAYAAVVGGICALYALYWFMVPGFLFYDTVKYLIFTFPVLGYLGNKATRDVEDIVSGEKATVAAAAAPAPAAAAKEE